MCYPVRKVNINEIPEETWASPKGRFVMAGKGISELHSHSVRHDSGSEPIVAGDAFLFKPGEAHQLIAGGEDLVVYVVADNPIGESAHFPDSGKWAVRSPQARILRSEPLDYWDGEE